MHPDILRLHAEVEERHWWFAARRHIVAQILAEVVSPGTGARVLDLGCGTGGTIGFLGSTYEGVGIELDHEAVAHARSAFPECEFNQGSIFAPEEWGIRLPVDVCLLMDVIEHLDDDAAAVRVATDALRPGGYLLVTVPAGPHLWSRHDRHHEHRRRYTAASLSEVLEGGQLHQCMMSYFNTRLYPVVRVSRWLQNRVPALGSRGTTGDLQTPPPVVNRILQRVFQGEGSRLTAVLRRDARPYRRGVSLMALYRKSDG